MERYIYLIMENEISVKFYKYLCTRNLRDTLLVHNVSLTCRPSTRILLSEWEQIRTYANFRGKKNDFIIFFSKFAHIFKDLYL